MTVDVQAAADPLVGRVLDGRYEVRERIARGGMATVYRALDTRLDREVAVKVMHPALAEDRGFVERFYREARTAARISHPCVVAVYDQGTDGAVVFLVMELVTGRTLRALLAERGRLSPEQALSLLEPVASALAVAHAGGLVHRDVKPENVLLGDDGRVLVADFGLARAVEPSPLTATTGVLLGTVAYLSPEQVTGGQADPRSDVYAAGVVLFEMVTGAPPFTGDSPLSIAYQHTHDDVPAPSSLAPGIPAGVDELVASTTARAAERRLADGAALLAAVRRMRRAIASGTPSTTIALPREEHHTVALAPSMAPSMPASTPRSAGLTSPAGGRAEPPAARRPRRRMRRGHVAALVLLLATIGAGAAGWWYGYARYTHTPGVIGMRAAAAEAKLSASHLTWVVDPNAVYDERIPAGAVVRETPGPGSKVTRGQRVKLVLSRGRELFAMPAFAPGAAKESVIAQLQAAHLVPQHAGDQYSDAVARGTVLSLSPASGSHPAGTVVQFVLSLGPRPVLVPSLANADPDAAAQQLRALRLKVATRQESSETVPEGKVTRTDPPAGSSLLPGATVTEYVSTGLPFVEVPDVRGQQLDQAKAALAAVGLHASVFVIPGGGDGSVISETHRGDRLRKGSTVTLFVF